MRRLNPVLAGLAALTVVASSCSDSNAPQGPGAPVKISVSAGDNQTGGAGETLVAPLAAKVTDAKGRGVPNVSVRFLSEGLGYVSPPTAKTNGAGIATTTWTLPTIAGTYRVRAFFFDSTTGAVVDTVSFRGRVAGGPPASLTIVNTVPTAAATGSDVTVSVLVRDSYYNFDALTPVTWTVTAGNGSVTGPAMTDSAGVATATLHLGTASGKNTLHITVGTQQLDVSVRGVVAGTPATLTPVTAQFEGNPGNVIKLAATVRDSLGTPVRGATVNWNVVSGSGALSATSSTTDSTGVASVNLTVADGTTTVRASIGTLSTQFTVSVVYSSTQLTSLHAELFGVGRTSGGKFVAAEISSGAVALFDEASPGAVTTVAVGGTPVVVATNAAGTTAYVSNLGGWVDVISIANATTMRVAIPSAHALALSPDEGHLYVTSTAGRAYDVSTSSRQVLDSVAIPNGPWGIAFRTTGTDTLMYVTARDGGSITEVNTRTMSVLRTFNVGGRPHGLVITADQTTLYAADISQGQIDIVDVASGTVTGTIPFGGAFGLAISADGSTIYATSDAYRAAVLSPATRSITRIYILPSNGRQVIASPDGATGWAADGAGNIDILKR